MTTAQTRYKTCKVNAQRVGRKEVNFESAHPVANDLLSTLLRLLPYIIAIGIGISIRTIIMVCKGYEYTIDGMDLLNAVLCVMIVFMIKFIRKNAR